MINSLAKMARIHPLLRLASVTAIAILIATGCARIPGFAESKPPPELEHGKNFLSAGDRDNATAKFDAAIATAPKDPRFYCEVMEISAKQNDRKLVEEYYAKAVENTLSLPKQKQARVHLSAGAAYLVMRAFEPAIQACKKAVELDPTNYRALNGWGYAYAEADRNLARAIEIVMQAIDLARKDNARPETLGAIIDSLGWAYYQNEQYGEAVSTLAEAAALAPGVAEIHYHLGLAYEKTNKLRQAQIALSRAMTIEPEMTLYKQALERVTAILKDRGELIPRSSVKPRTPSPRVSP